jgi:hypothetical protein
VPLLAGDEDCELLLAASERKFDGSVLLLAVLELLLALSLLKFEGR